MTLVLTAVAKQHVFHASDRLLTYRTTRGGDVWDAEANKTVIVMGDDCWLVLGYTGAAYVGGRSTAQLLAECISGVADLSTGGFIGWQRPRPFHLQAIVDRLVTCLNTAWLAVPSHQRASGLQVSIGGIQNATPRPAHVLWDLSLQPSGIFAVHRADLSGFRWDAGYALTTVGAAAAEEIEQLRADLREHGEESPEVFRDLLVECVQRTAAREPTVGRDTMAVVLKPAADRIEVYYRPGPRTGVDDTLRLPTTAFSPWALTPAFIYAPARIVGVQEWQLSGSSTVYAIDGPAGPGARISYSSHRGRGAPS